MALELQRCGACGRWVWFPRVACPSCFEPELEWRQASGLGTVRAHAAVHRPHRPSQRSLVPIVLALIELDEGCEMVASLLGDDRTDVRAGDRVRVAEESGWSTLPQFSLVRERRVG